MKPKLRAIRDTSGGVLLFDIYVGGEWHGSRRTYDQCIAYLRSVYR